MTTELNVMMEMFKESFQILNDYINKQEKAIVDVLEAIKTVYKGNIKDTHYHINPTHSVPKDGGVCFSIGISVKITFHDDSEINHEFNEILNKSGVWKVLSDMVTRKILPRDILGSQYGWSNLPKKEDLDKFVDKDVFAKMAKNAGTLVQTMPKITIPNFDFINKKN